MKSRFRISTVGFGLALAWALPAMAQDGPARQEDPVARAQALSREGRPDLAYALLAPLAEARAGDPGFDFLLGVAAVDSGRAAEAIVALQRVIAVQPGNAAARAELARAYALAGDVDTAQREFNTVMGDPTLPDPVRQRFIGILSRLDRTIAGGGTDVAGFAELGAGYDSNVNSATNLPSLVIPLFAALGPATLSQGAVSQSDGYLRAEGGLSVVHGLDRQNRVFASAFGSMKQNFEVAGFNQGIGALTAGYSHSLAGGAILSASGQGQRVWFAGRAFRSSVGGQAQVTLPVGNGDALSFSGQYSVLDYHADRLRDGSRYGAGMSYVTRHFLVNAQLGEEKVRKGRAEQFAHLFAGGGVAGELPLSAAASLVANASVERRDYQAIDPLYLRERADWQFDIGASLRLKLTERLILKSTAAFTRNHSNIALYGFRRLTAALNLRAEF